MKHFTKIMSAAVLTAATLSFPGCQDYDAGFEAKEIAYRKNFEKAFGQIDPEQDFNLATRGSVTVTTNEESNVKIYAKSGRIYTIVGNYSGVTGTQKLEFDVVEGTTQLLVTNGKSAEYVNVGDEVHFAPQTRTMCNLGSIVSVSSNYKEIPASVITAYTTVIPEEENNYQKVSCNFYWVSTGSFTFYPMYWDTGEHHTMGIYWTDSEGYHELDVYKDKCGDEVQYPGELNTHWDAEKGETVIDGVKTWRNEGVGQTIQYHSELGLRAKGITIALPVGQVFGMYIRDYNSCPNTWDEENKIGVFNGGSGPYWTVYSEEDKNAHCALPPYSAWQTPTKAPADKMVFASTFQANATVNGKTVTNTYFAFEDMIYFPDLNDLIFMFDEESNIPVTVDNDADGWILAYEDLGNSFDWDYNDVVLAVEHVSGETSAKIIPLAAGGTLASYVKYNGSYVTGSKETSEIHQLFGQAAAESGNYTPINADDKGNIGFVQTITVPTTFSMTTLGATTGAISEMGGITLEVEPADGSTALPTTIVYSLENKGKAPEVMCLPQSWHEHSESNGVTTTAKHEWRWPSELSNIDKAYSQFAAWAKDRTNTEWYKQTPNMSYCVTGTFDYTSTSTANGGGGTGSGTTVGAITLVSDHVTLEVNEVKTLLGGLFTTTSTGKIHYSLSNSHCSFQDDNTKIKGASAGSVDLTILQEADATHDQCKALIHIDVVNPNDLKMYGGSVPDYSAANDISVSVNAGETLQLYKNCSADGALTYSIADADKAIATVDENGLITGVAKGGPVTITVTQAPSSTYAGGTATVNVTVTDPLPAGMSWSGPTTIYVSNGEDVWLTGLTIQSDATTPTFESNNTAVVPSTFSKEWNGTVGNHIYKATAGTTAGTAVITITQGKTEGKYRASELTFTVKVAADPQFKFSDGTNATKNIVLSPNEINNPFTGCTKLSNGTISYSVTDGDDVVSVNSTTGEITVKNGVTEGEATVVATLAEEGNYNGGTLTVNVTILSYGTKLTNDNDNLTVDNGTYDIYATFSTTNLPTEGSVTFSVQIDKGSGYINTQNKGIHKSSDGSSYTQITPSNFKAGNTDGVVQYTINATDYKDYSYLKIITDAGQGATIINVYYKVVQ